MDFSELRIYRMFKFFVAVVGFFFFFFSFNITKVSTKMAKKGQKKVKKELFVGALRAKKAPWLSDKVLYRSYKKACVKGLNF